MDNIYQVFDDSKAMSSEKEKSREELLFKTVKRLIIIVVPIIVLLVAVFPVFHSVPAGHRGVILEFGKPVGIADQGLFIGFPYWRVSVVDISVQTLKFEDPHADAASKDLQAVLAKIAVNYHLDPTKVDEIYKSLNLAWEDRVIRPNIQEVVKATMAQFTAEELITKRAVVQLQVFDAFTKRLQPYGIIVEAINIVDFQFAKSFSDAIEAKVVAEQNALKEENNLKTARILAQQRVANAEGLARSEVAQANGTAISTVLKAQADAKALELLKQQINPQLLQLRSLEKWDGKLPVILVTADGKQIPFIIDISSIIGKNQTAVTKP